MKKLQKFLIGFGSIFNIFGNYHDIKILSDEEAMEYNWKKISQDFNFLKN